MLERWAAQYGTMYTFRLGLDRALVVSDPELTQQVMRARPDTFRRTTKVQRVFEELGVNGLFSAEGPAWRPQRRLAMEALAHRNLRGFFPTLCTVAARLQRRWERAADSGEPLDMVEELKRFTVDVTTTLTFGHDINTVEDAGGDVIQRKLELVFPAFNRRLFALVPLWRIVRMPRDRRLDRALAELRDWIDGLVREARARLAADPARQAEPAHFLEAMLLARDDAGQPFSDDTIFANLMTMLLAGEDTTAYTLAWAIHHLCDSPAAVRALQAEVDAAPRGEIGRGVPASFEAANELAYAGAIAQESMRLRPVAPVIIFETIVDTVIGDVAVPAGNAGRDVAAPAGARGRALSPAGRVPARAVARRRAGRRARAGGAHAVRIGPAHLPGTQPGAAGDEAAAGHALRRIRRRARGRRARTCASSSRSRCRRSA